MKPNTFENMVDTASLAPFLSAASKAATAPSPSNSAALAATTAAPIRVKRASDRVVPYPEMTTVSPVLARSDGDVERVGGVHAEHYIIGLAYPEQGRGRLLQL
jgi:hypothetical protein